MEKILDRFRDRVFYNGQMWYKPTLHENFVELATEFVEYKDLEVPPMQCLGRRDKNGKLIYEGDIISYCGVMNWEVKYKETDLYCGFVLQHQKHYNAEWDNENFEVLGNIHENPELLEVRE